MLTDGARAKDGDLSLLAKRGAAGSGHDGKGGRAKRGTRGLVGCEGLDGSRRRKRDAMVEFLINKGRWPGL